MILHASQENLALYIHWPFCLSKCPYCDFNSHTFAAIDYQLWQQSYLRQIDYFADVIRGKKIGSIFFGGGTPSLMPAKLIAAILAKINSLAPLAAECEITIEANPTSVESSRFADFKAAGVNRASLGVQSFTDANLQFLGRGHNAKEATYAIEVAAKHFDNYSFDLIYALPSQSLQEWRSELSLALSFGSKHLSLYQLTIEKGTPFYALYHKKQFALPSQELSCQMYQLSDDLLKPLGYQRYEISNYAQNTYASKHNLTYWRYGSYLGLGPGAHSRIAFLDQATNSWHMQSMEIVYSPANWLEQIAANGHAIKQLSALSTTEVLQEVLMMGLRLTAGIDNYNLKTFSGKSFAELIDGNLLQQLVACDLLYYDQEGQRLSDKGLALHSSITSKLFAAIKTHGQTA